MSESVSQQWEETWQQVLSNDSLGGSSLFSISAQIGSKFAVACLIFFAWQYAQQYLKERNDFEFLFGPKTLIRVFLAAILLANNGAQLQTALLAGHKALNDMNHAVLQLSYSGVELTQIYREARDIGASAPAIAQMIRPCESFTGEQQVQCVDNAVDNALAFLEDMQTQHPLSSWLRSRISDLIELKDSIANDNIPFVIGDNIFWAVTSPYWETAVLTVLWAWQGAFQNCVEAVSLMVALFTPMAVGGFMMPMQGPGSLGLWLTGFISIHLLKTAYNIMAGLAALTFVNTQLGEPLVFPIIVGVFSPVFAVLIMTSGAMGVWMGLVGIVERGVSMVAK